jgi:hypothetical protein
MRGYSFANKGYCVRKPSDRRFLRTIARLDGRAALPWVALTLALIQCQVAVADVYKCVGVGGAISYSDSPCDPTPDRPAPQAAPSCSVACGNHSAGDPDFGHTKYCQISFQCDGHPMQQVRVSEGRSLTLACAP